MRVTTGTSGFAYKEWKGAFYRAFTNNDPPPDQNDEAPVSPNLIANAGSSGLAGSQAGPMSIRTNTSAQIRYRSAVASGAFTISTTGWVDRRGRDD